MSEESDAVILVVSEETGAISLAFDSKIYYDLSALEITRRLRDLLDRGARRESFVSSPADLGGALKPGSGPEAAELSAGEEGDVFAKL
jgi:diadenylate cyclase